MRALLLLVLLLVQPLAAQAGVRIDFYSRHQARHFPHAFVVLRGTVDATGEAVDANYGFTPYGIGPALLVGPVRGKVASADAAYVARAVRWLSLELTDEEYRRVTAVVEEWRARPQPSYHLDDRNCVTFVAAVAAAAGLDPPAEPRLMKKPAAFLQALRNRNQPLLSARRSPAEHPAVAAAPALVETPAAPR